MFPKQTQLQNSTLSIQMPVSSVSWLASPPRAMGSAYALSDSLRYVKDEGVGITSGLMPSRTAEPATPTAIDSRKPGFDRSIRYHKNGLTSASVRETWRVEAHGSFRCRQLAVSQQAEAR